MARQKTIDEIRSELRLEKDKTRKLRKELADTRFDMWLRAAAIVEGIAADYPVSLFPEPEPDSPPERYAAAGVRLAAKNIFEAFMRRAKEAK